MGINISIILLFSDQSEVRISTFTFHAAIISSVDLKPLSDKDVLTKKNKQKKEMDYCQKMWKFAIDSSRLMFGVNLVAGPAITGDGDCILGAAHSQVFVWL